MANQVLTSAAALWRFLKKNAGADTVFYDKDFLNAEAPNPGLRANLKIAPAEHDLEIDLLSHNTSTEQFVVAFFRSLQPYAQMMKELCVFFEKYRVKETNKSLRVEFDFEEAGKEKLDFNLEHFRDAIQKYTTVRQILTYYAFDQNNLFKPHRILFKNDLSGKALTREIQEWDDSFLHQRISVPRFEIPSTSNAVLDEPLKRLFGIANGFIEAVLEMGDDPKIVRSQLRTFSDIDNPQTIYGGWSAYLLRVGMKDHWPTSLITGIYKVATTYIEMNDLISTEDWQEIGDQLTVFLDEIAEQQEVDKNYLSELTELLKLPTWKHRYELYATWILSVIDQTLQGYTGEIHDNKDVLILSFKATHILSYPVRGGTLELWSEVRYPLAKPRSPERKGNIQPDYSLIYGNPVAAVEVKQYRQPSTKKFSDAINDYADGLKNAQIFLVNYSAMSENLDLKFADRSHFYGMIRPADSNKLVFMEKLLAHLPKPPAPAFPHDLLPGGTASAIPEIQYLFIDVSRSLDLPEYKDYLERLLDALTANGHLQKVIAVDERVREFWDLPNEQAMTALRELNFRYGTDFVELLPKDNENFLVVTDEDGESKVIRTGRKGIKLAVFEPGKDIVFRVTT